MVLSFLERLLSIRSQQTGFDKNINFRWHVQMTSDFSHNHVSLNEERVLFIYCLALEIEGLAICYSHPSF